MELNRIGIKRPAWPCKHANKIDVKKRALQSPMRRAIDIIKKPRKNNSSASGTNIPITNKLTKINNFLPKIFLGISGGIKESIFIASMMPVYAAAKAKFKTTTIGIINNGQKLISLPSLNEDKNPLQPT